MVPTYTFICNQKNGCGFSFQMEYSMSEYDRKVAKLKCPHCNKQVSRNFAVDKFTAMDTGSKMTLGTYAEKNTGKVSADEKAHITYKHNKYKLDIPQKPLPKGMRYGKQVLQEDQIKQQIYDNNK